MMKKYLLPCLSLIAALAVTSCSSDEQDFDTYTLIDASKADLSYTNGVWTDNTKNVNLVMEGYEFSHHYEDMSGYDYIYGFTTSRINDTTEHTPLYTYPYASMSGGGPEGTGSPYIVGYWDNYYETDTFDGRTCRIFAANGEEFRPQSVLVNNTSYVYYALLNGNPGISRPFKFGDTLTLIAHGVHPDGSESKAEFFLANIIDADDVASGIITKWTQFDLSGLGTCTGIYFTMESSDTSDYGMNSPSYFCLDKLILKD